MMRAAVLACPLLLAISACAGPQTAPAALPAHPTEDHAELHTLLLRQLALLAEISAPWVSSAEAGDLTARERLLQVDAQILRAGLIPLRTAFSVAAEPLSAEHAAALGLDAGFGAQLTAVEAGGPAAKAGLQTGDCLLRVDGEPLCFAGPAARCARGEPVRVEVLRPGATPARQSLECLLRADAVAGLQGDPELEADAILQRALRQVLREAGTRPIVPPPAGIR